MSISESIRLAFANLKSNRMRAFLTMLGIIIGISAVITITTIGNSIQKTIAATLREMGNTNLVYAYADAIYPDFQTEEEWENWVYPEMTENERIDYKKIIKFQEDFADRVDSVILTEYLNASTADGTDKTSNISLMGVTPGYLDSSKIKILSGREISDVDNRKTKATAVVSDLFVKYACNGENPIGKKISVQMQDNSVQRFYVVGVYKYDILKQGNPYDKTPEYQIATPVFIPYTYGVDINKANGEYYGDSVNFQFTAKDGVDPTELAQEVTDYFYDNYFAENGNFELFCQDMQSELTQINQVLNILTIAISVIAAISLVVGGVGVMNIMLVSVIERTREIGIRKAMGAKNKSIRRQFLMEAIVICLMGGFIGILVGIVNGFILAQIASVLSTQYQDQIGAVLKVTVSPSIVAIVISVVFSILIGLVFGSYPAKRAANMSPIDALRYE